MHWQYNYAVLACPCSVSLGSSPVRRTYAFAIPMILLFAGGAYAADNALLKTYCHTLTEYLHDC